MERAWVIVVPVKRLGVAKSRLSGDVGGHRRDLALAMALDTIDAAAAARSVRVVVVTDDEAVRSALAGTDVRVVADEPGSGINAALLHGAGAVFVRHDEGVAALAADLPALRTAELHLALNRAAAYPQAFLADAVGTGTSLYAAAGGRDVFEPRFGVGSARAHATTAPALDPTGLTSLQRDVDTIDDLREAAALGLHHRTMTVVRRLDGVQVDAVRPAS